MVDRRTLTGLAATFVLCGLAIAPAATAQIERGPLTFTAGQAEAGEATYANACRDCHGYRAQGGEAPSIVGEGFARFADRSVAVLYDFISRNMPYDQPGSRTAEEYLDIVAFLALVNGFEPGPVPLPPDTDALAAMDFRQ